MSRTATYLIGALVLTLAAGAGCILDEGFEEDEIGEDEQAAYGWCKGCGLNGLRQQAYSYIWSQLDRNALTAHSAWGTNGPKSLCKPWRMYSNWCEMRNVWVNWLRSSPHAIHVDQMANLVKLAAPNGYQVREVFADGSYGYRFSGDFELVDNILDGEWSWADQEKVTAGMALLLNQVEGVSICLLTPDKPSHCAGSEAYWHETAAFGNIIQGSRYVALHGGQHAQIPLDNFRIEGIAASSVDDAFTWWQQRCSFAGSGETRVATNCQGWTNPVTALTPFKPSDWYYGGSAPRPKPPGVPEY